MTGMSSPPNDTPGAIVTIVFSGRHSRETPAELDTLRGELVRELDRMAEGDDGSGSFRRVAS